MTPEQQPAPAEPAESPELAAVSAVLSGTRQAMLRSTVPDQRLVWEAVGAGQSLDPGTAVAEVELGGVPADEIVAPGAERRHVVVHFHGGGYGIGSRGTHRAFGARLSAATGAAVYMVEYRLAPEEPFPAAFDDAMAAYAGALSLAGGPARVLLSGDSAGGGLVVAVLAAAAGRGLAQPAGAICFSPWVDADPDLRRPAGCDAVIDSEWLGEMARRYLGDADPADPRVSPVHGDLRGVAPLLLLVGRDELLRPDTDRLAARAQAAGVAVTTEELPTAVHLWMLLAPDTPESRRSLQAAGDFARARLAAAGAV